MLIHDTRILTCSNAWILPASRLYGYHVVSIAYRLLPHAQLPHMLSDCADALRWCIQNLASIIGTDQVDLNSFVVAGDSAGGMLSTLCGHYLDPKPKAVISLFGITDPTDNVFHLKTGRNPWGPYAAERDEDEMRRHLERRDLSEAEVICPWDWEVDMPLEQLRSYWGMPSFTPNESHAYRMDLNRLMSNDGTRFAYLLQRHRYQSDKEFEEGMKLYSPYHLLQEGRSYPPTVILHGKKDRMVSVEQSYRFAARLKELGVPVEERYPPDGDHSFDAVIEVRQVREFKHRSGADSALEPGRCRVGRVYCPLYGIPGKALAGRGKRPDSGEWDIVVIFIACTFTIQRR